MTDSDLERLAGSISDKEPFLEFVERTISRKGKIMVVMLTSGHREQYTLTPTGVYNSGYITGMNGSCEVIIDLSKVAYIESF